MDRWFAEGRANGETQLPSMYFDLHVPPDDLATALRVQAARLDRPTFTREALDREVPRTLGEADQVDRSDEGYTAKFAAMAFVQAALRGEADIPLHGEDACGLTVDDVRDFWTRSARPDRAILCVAGAFDPEAVRKQIEAAFGAIPRAVRPRAGGSPAAEARPDRRDVGPPGPAPPDRLAGAPGLRPRPPGPDRRVARPDAALLHRPRHRRWRSSPPSATTPTDASSSTPTSFPAPTLESLEAKILDRVGKLSGQGAPTSSRSPRCAAAVGQMLGFVDVDTIPLPPGVSRSMVRANVELQRLVKELSWGDPASYRKRIDAVDARAVRDAAARHLDPARATVVRLGPGR